MPTCKPPPSCAADVPEAAGSLATSSFGRPYPLFRSLPPAVTSPMNPFRAGQAVACMFRSAAQRQTVAKGSPNCVCAEGAGSLAASSSPSSPSFSVSSACGGFTDEPAPHGAKRWHACSALPRSGKRLRKVPRIAYAPKGREAGRLRGKEREGHEKSDNSAIRREAVLRNCPSPGLKKMPCFP